MPEAVVWVAMVRVTCRLYSFRSEHINGPCLNECGTYLTHFNFDGRALRGRLCHSHKAPTDLFVASLLDCKDNQPVAGMLVRCNGYRCELVFKDVGDIVFNCPVLADRIEECIEHTLRKTAFRHLQNCLTCNKPVLDGFHCNSCSVTECSSCFKASSPGSRMQTQNGATVIALDAGRDSHRLIQDATKLSTLASTDDPDDMPNNASTRRKRRASLCETEVAQISARRRFDNAKLQATKRATLKMSIQEDAHLCLLASWPATRSWNRCLHDDMDKQIASDACRLATELLKCQHALRSGLTCEWIGSDNSNRHNVEGGTGEPHDDFKIIEIILIPRKFYKEFSSAIVATDAWRAQVMELNCGHFSGVSHIAMWLKPLMSTWIRNISAIYMRHSISHKGMVCFLLIGTLHLIPTMPIVDAVWPWPCQYQVNCKICCTTSVQMNGRQGRPLTRPWKEQGGKLAMHSN